MQLSHKNWHHHGGRVSRTVDDATTGAELVEAVNDDITRVTADAALRHSCLLPCGPCTGRNRRGSAGQDGQGVPAYTEVECS